jgi:hypothetical protein
MGLCVRSAANQPIPGSCRTCYAESVAREHEMLKNAIAAFIVAVALSAIGAEQIRLAGDGIISLGESVRC